MKKTIKLTESSLRNLIKESVYQILNEISYDTAANAYTKSFNKMLNGGNNNKQVNNLYNHLKDKSEQRVDPNMTIRVVGGELEGDYLFKDFIKIAEINGEVTPSRNPIYAKSKTIGYPRIAGYVGPMWDGDAIRYESQEVNNTLSM